MGELLGVELLIPLSGFHGNDVNQEIALSHNVAEIAEIDARILMIGFGDGSILIALREAGRRYLTGFDNREDAAMYEIWPEIREACDLAFGSLGEMLSELPTRAFDVVVVNRKNVDAGLVAAAANEAVVLVGKDPAPYQQLGLKKWKQTRLPNGDLSHTLLVTMQMREFPNLKPLKL